MIDLTKKFEEEKEKHMKEAKAFMEDFLKEARISDFISDLNHYMQGDRDGPEICQFFYDLPNLRGTLKRDIHIRYFPYHDHIPKGKHGEILYRNVIISNTSDILEFLNDSDIFRVLVPIVLQNLRKIGGFTIPQEVLNENRDCKIKEFKVIDHLYHTPEGRKDFCYCTAVSMLVTPDNWKTPALAIGNIENSLRQQIKEAESTDLNKKSGIFKIEIN